MSEKVVSGLREVADAGAFLLPDDIRPIADYIEALESQLKKSHLIASLWIKGLELCIPSKDKERAFKTAARLVIEGMKKSNLDLEGNDEAHLEELEQQLNPSREG